MTPEEMQRLKDRIEMLEDVIGVHKTMTERLRESFQLKPPLAKFLGMLYQRSYVTRDSLYTVLYGDRNDSEIPEPKILDVHTCMLRRKLVVHGIGVDTKFGVGWEMTPANKAKVREVIEGHAMPVPIAARRMAFLEGH